MKKLMFILISCLAFAQDPKKPDTAGLAPELKAALVKIETENKKAEVLDKKLQAAETEKKKAERERSSLYSRFKTFFHEYFGPGDDQPGRSNRAAAVKEENRNDPVEEIEIYDGTDSVRAGWLYRLFHKDDYYLKRYKIVNNEKVYLD